MRAVSLGFGCTCLLAALVPGCPSGQAQTMGDPSGLTAGALLFRGRVIGVFPQDRDTTIAPIGGYVGINNTASPELDLSYFVTDHIAIEGETGITRNSLTAEDTEIGTIPIGHVWSAPVILAVQYHALPRSRWNPYLGAGLDILPYFDADPAGGRVQQLSVTSQLGATLQAGMDLRITGPWYGNLDVKKLFVGSHASVDDGMITAGGHIDPWIVGLGIGYRF